MKVLKLFVEGAHDKIFFSSEKITKILLSKGFDSIECYEYEHLTKIKVRKFISTIAQCSSWEFIFSADKDKLPCITKAIEENRKIFNIRNINRIVIVNCEIESWYLAGISKKIQRKYRLNIPRDTQNVTKEQFNIAYIPKITDKFSFLTEVAEEYDVRVAKTRNQSFNYFINRLENKILI